jgi:hypothetical protein
MHHITSIRHKLQIGGRRGPAAVFLWALLAHITRLPSAQAEVLARPPRPVTVPHRPSADSPGNA